MAAVAGISPDEHRARQRALRAAAADRGLQAVIAFARGGGTHDRLADGLWLCGLAAAQPFVVDLPGHWRAAGHVALAPDFLGDLHHEPQLRRLLLARQRVALHRR